MQYRREQHYVGITFNNNRPRRPQQQPAPPNPPRLQRQTLLPSFEIQQAVRQACLTVPEDTNIGTEWTLISSAPILPVGECHRPQSGSQSEAQRGGISIHIHEEQPGAGGGDNPYIQARPHDQHHHQTQHHNVIIPTQTPSCPAQTPIGHIPPTPPPPTPPPPPTFSPSPDNQTPPTHQARPSSSPSPSPSNTTINKGSSSFVLLEARCKQLASFPWRHVQHQRAFVADSLLKSAASPHPMFRAVVEYAEYTCYVEFRYRILGGVGT